MQNTQTTHLSIKLSTSQLRDAAMRQQGLSPKALAIKPGTRVEGDRKAASKRGYSKHKRNLFD
jgi:hypothetical protein